MCGRPEAFAALVSEARHRRDPARKPVASSRRSNGRALDRFARIAKALGIANVMTAYRVPESGPRRSAIRHWKEFTEVPAAPMSAERAAKKALADAKRTKKRDRLLLAEAVSAAYGASPRQRPSTAFVVATPSKCRGSEMEFMLYAPPWRKPALLPIPRMECHSMSTDAARRRLALGGVGWAVRATEDWRELRSSLEPVSATTWRSIDRGALLCASTAKAPKSSASMTRPGSFPPASSAHDTTHPGSTSCGGCTPSRVSSSRRLGDRRNGASSLSPYRPH